MTAAIEWDKIGELLWVGPLATLTVVVAFALLTTGGVRMHEARRAGRSIVAAAYAMVAAAGGLSFLAVVAFGLHVIIDKR